MSQKKETLKDKLNMQISYNFTKDWIKHRGFDIIIQLIEMLKLK